jgi:hypothetical protein
MMMAFVAGRIIFLCQFDTVAFYVVNGANVDPVLADDSNASSGLSPARVDFPGTWIGGYSRGRIELRRPLLLGSGR